MKHGKATITVFLLLTVGRHDSLPPDVATHYQILKNINHKWFFLCF